ncbi:MAG: T9SS type A sorting domain-containing protein [Bacteroidetes bacterium]|nr:T9SS type A sorting domain-containing protein [Bacteroidota bacterium]
MVVQVGTMLAIFANFRFKYLISGTTNGTYSGPSYGDVSDSSFSLVFDSTYWKYDNWLLLIDSAGNKIWDRRYGCLKADDFAICAALSSNGNIAIGSNLGMASLQGNFYPCNDGIQDTLPRGYLDIWGYVIETAKGNMLKQRRIGGNSQDQIWQIIATTDGGYLCVCLSTSDSSFEKSENRKVNLADPNNYDFWLVRMDSNLNIIWDKTIGSGKRDETPSLILLNDSTFILAGVVTAGNSGDVGAPLYDSLINDAHDFWVSKWHIVNPSNIDELNRYSFNLYPNPIKDILYITLQNAKNKTYHLQVQDITGRMIEQKDIVLAKSNTVMLETNAWLPGVYVVNIEGVSKKW